MTDGKYDRSVELLCPTCGGNQFEYNEHDDTAPMICASCSLSMSRNDLIAENGENIGAHVEQITGEVAANLKNKLQQAFRGSKLFKVK